LTPAVDRQVAVASSSVAVQLGAQETRGPSKQLRPGAVSSVCRGKCLGPRVGHFVLPYPHKHSSIGPQTSPHAWLSVRRPGRVVRDWPCTIYGGANCGRSPQRTPAYFASRGLGLVREARIVRCCFDTSTRREPAQR